MASSKPSNEPEDPAAKYAKELLRKWVDRTVAIINPNPTSEVFHNATTLPKSEWIGTHPSDEPKPE